jgi:hypothetical protein
VPFELDPTVLLTSNGSVNPLRQIARVQPIVGKEYDLVTTAGVTVTRVAANTPATDNSPTLAQPTIKAERVQGFIPFNIEIEGDWTGMQASMMELLRDAKDIEEATAFTLGTGTSPDAGGVVTTLNVGSKVDGQTGAVLSITTRPTWRTRSRPGSAATPRSGWGRSPSTTRTGSCCSRRPVPRATRGTVPRRAAGGVLRLPGLRGVRHGLDRRRDQEGRC